MRHVEHLIKERHRPRRKLNLHARALGHLARMPDQAKARNVGASVKLESLGQTNRGLVEGAHRVKHRTRLALLDELALNGRGDDARADRLGQQQNIAHVRAAVGEHAVEWHKTAHGQAVLGLVVVDGVAARDGAPRP